MNEKDNQLSRIATFVGVMFLIWLMYMLSMADAEVDLKNLRGVKHF